MLLEDRRAGLLIIAVGITRARSRAHFHEYFVAAPNQLIRRRWRQRHAKFLRLNFFWNADDHARQITRSILRESKSERHGSG